MLSVSRYVLFVFLIILFPTSALAAASSLNLDRLEQVSLPVSNIAAAETFYEQTLGLRKLLKKDNILIFDLGGSRLFLGKAETKASARATLYLRCADLKLCTDKLKAKGVRFHQTPEFVARQASNDLWIVFFSDPDGNSLALMSEAPRGFNSVTGEFLKGE